MEAKLPVILHDQLSSVDYSCCRFPQKESNEYCCSHKEEKFYGIAGFGMGGKCAFWKRKKRNGEKRAKRFLG